jgi:DNA polymerase III subunit delta
MDSLAFLQRTAAGPSHPIYVLHGDEDYLKRQVVAALRQRLLGDDPDSMGLSTLSGETATFAGVHDDLETLPFLSARRLVVVEQADPFVTKYRAALEAYLDKPAAHGTLVLEVKSWPATTRLYKLIDPDATIACKAPSADKLSAWCAQWASRQHGKALTLEAASMLVDLVGPHLGMLDQELAKLTAYAGEAKQIDVEAVDRVVGHSREEQIFKIFGAIGANQPGEALAILGRVFDQGDDPLRILGAFSWQLRQLAQAARLSATGQPLSAALQEVGVKPFALKGAEQQLRQLGRERANRLYDWLLEADLGLKGGSQLPARTVLERLVVKLAAKT